jgi:hypothetical protein
MSSLLDRLFVLLQIAARRPLHSVQKAEYIEAEQGKSLRNPLLIEEEEEGIIRTLRLLAHLLRILMANDHGLENIRRPTIIGSNNVAVSSNCPKWRVCFFHGRSIYLAMRQCDICLTI